MPQSIHAQLIHRELLAKITAADLNYNAQVQLLEKQRQLQLSPRTELPKPDEVSSDEIDESELLII